MTKFCRPFFLNQKDSKFGKKATLLCTKIHNTSYIKYTEITFSEQRKQDFFFWKRIWYNHGESNLIKACRAQRTMGWPNILNIKTLMT